MEKAAIQGFDDQAIATAVEACRKDAVRDQYYALAPDGARMFIALTFFGDHFDRDIDAGEFARVFSDLVSGLTDADLAYLLLREPRQDLVLRLKAERAKRAIKAAKAAAAGEAAENEDPAAMTEKPAKPASGRGFWAVKLLFVLVAVFILAEIGCLIYANVRMQQDRTEDANFRTRMAASARLARQEARIKKLEATIERGRERLQSQEAELQSQKDELKELKGSADEEAEEE